MPISPFRPSLLIVTNFCIDNFECHLFPLRASEEAFVIILLLDVSNFSTIILNRIKWDIKLSLPPNQGWICYKACTYCFCIFCGWGGGLLNVNIFCPRMLVGKIALSRWDLITINFSKDQIRIKIINVPQKKENRAEVSSVSTSFFAQMRC